MLVLNHKGMYLHCGEGMMAARMIKHFRQSLQTRQCLVNLTVINKSGITFLPGHVTVIIQMFFQIIAAVRERI